MAPGPLAAVPLVGGAAERHVDEAQFLVGAHQAPRLGAAGVLPRLALPGLDARLAGTRHDVEGPAQGAGADVVAADVAGRQVDLGAAVGPALAADDHHVADHQRPGRRPPEAGGLVAEPGQQVDLAAVAEALDDAAGAGVDGVQVAAAHVEHAGAARPGPVGEVAAGAGAGQIVGRHRLRPHRASGRRIERLGDAEGVGRVEQAAGLERRGPEVGRDDELGIGRLQRRVDRRPPPDHAQRADVGGGDPVERRVLRAGLRHRRDWASRCRAATARGDRRPAASGRWQGTGRRAGAWPRIVAPGCNAGQSPRRLAPIRAAGGGVDGRARAGYTRASPDNADVCADGAFPRVVRRTVPAHRG